MLLSVAAYSAQWSGKAVVETDSVWVGDRFSLRIEVVAPAASSVSLPGWQDLLAPCDVLDWSVDETQVEKGWTKHTWHARLRTLEAGPLRLGPIPALALTGKDTLRLDVAPVDLNVHARLSDTVSDIQDIEPPMPDPHWPWWAWVLLGLPLLALLGYLLWKMRKKRLDQAVIHVPEPYEEAHAALQALVARGLLDKGEQAEYFVELGMIIRRYLQRRYTVEVLDATSVELRQRLAHVKGLPQAYRESTLRFAEETDLVKFARAALDPEKARHWEEWAARLLEDTRPAPEAPEEDKSKGGR